MADRDSPIKTAAPQPAGGSANSATGLVPGAGEDFDKKLVAYKQRMKANTDAIKRWLAQGIKRAETPADYASMSAALLELAFERYLDLHGEEDAKDLIDRAFRRVVRERRGPLQ